MFGPECPADGADGYYGSCLREDANEAPKDSACLPVVVVSRNAGEKA